MNTRRQFIRCVSATGAAMLVGVEAMAADLPMVDEKDATAVALGYVADASRVNKAKFTTFAAGQACSGCQLFQGKAGEKSGPCPLYAGKQVSAAGWCSAFAKKA